MNRRRWLRAGLRGVGAAAGLTAAGKLADAYGLIPPDHSGLFGIGETLTYASQRLIESGHSKAREFDRSRISKVAPVNGGPPRDTEYLRMKNAQFSDWRLDLMGLVDRPGSFSLEDLKQMPRQSQTTMLACEEGWSYIAEWTGVRLSDFLEAAGIRHEARYVLFFPFDESWESLDMADALHPQTLLAYEMNGADLSEGHGAPLRVRVPRQLGYKSVKYLTSIEVADTLKPYGKGLGSYSPEIGYSWWAGI